MSNFKPKKIGDMRYQIDPDSFIGMKVPVTIYADEKLLTKMMTDRTIQQAVNADFPLVVLLQWMQRRG